MNSWLVRIKNYSKKRVHENYFKNITQYSLKTRPLIIWPCPCDFFKLTRFSYWRRQWQPTPVLLLGKSHGWRSLVGCSPWGCSESDTTERLPFHFSLSCIGEGNVNPLQCSCLENPRDGGAWWAAFYGVAQSRTRLKRLSSSSSNVITGVVMAFSVLQT